MKQPNGSDSKRRPIDGERSKVQDKLSSYFLFDAICRMLECNARGAKLKRLREQRAALERKLGYDEALHREYKAFRREIQRPVEQGEMREFMEDAKKRMQRALAKRLGPDEKLPIPSFD